MKRKFSFLFLIFFITSCGVQEAKRVIEPEVTNRANDYQIGDEWSLKVDDQSGLEDSIFRIESLGNNTIGVAFYLGKVEETYLFITNVHIVDQYIDLCNSNIRIKNQSSESLFTCDSFIHTLRRSDISIISMKKVEDTDYNTDNLAPLTLSNERVFNTSERLKLSTVDSENRIVTDTSQDCRFLDQAPRTMTDIDLLNPVFGDYLSLPVGCDAAHGNSGSPIFGESGEVKAVLWTGKSPKTFFNSTELLELTESNDPRVWTEFNLVIPSYIIYDEILDQNHWFETDKEKRILQGFFNHSQ